MSQSLVRFVLVTAMILAVHLPPGYGQAASSQYYGYEAQYKVKVEFVRVRMRDGVELAARIARPDAEGRFPAIMGYLPYRRLTAFKPAPSGAGVRPQAACLRLLCRAGLCGNRLRRARDRQLSRIEPGHLRRRRKKRCLRDGRVDCRSALVHVERWGCGGCPTGEWCSGKWPSSSLRI